MYVLTAETHADLFIGQIFVTFAFKSNIIILMKHIFISLAMAFAALAGFAAEEEPWYYVDAQDLRVINKGWENTLRPR